MRRPEQLGVDPVGDQLDRADLAAGAGQLRRAHHHRAGVLEQHVLVGLEPGPPPLRLRGEQPVVGDVVDGGPSTPPGEGRIGGIVDPENGTVQPARLGGLEHLAIE